jgi:hypothetical protein
MTLPVFYIAFTRPGKNLITKLLQSKKYVVCHLHSASTDFDEVYLVIPNPDFFTKVGKFDYNLNPNYAIMKWKSRLHFYLNEADAIPRYLTRSDSNQEVLMQVQEIKTALHNKAYNFLYGKSPNIALIVACVGMAIAILLAVYGVYEYQKMAPIVDYVYAHQIAIDSTITPK